MFPNICSRMKGKHWTGKKRENEKIGRGGCAQASDRRAYEYVNFVPGEKADSYRMEQQRGRKSVLRERASRRLPVVNGDRHAIVAAGVATNHDNRLQRRYFPKRLATVSEIPLQEQTYLRGVYCERDKGDRSVFTEGAWK